MPVQDTPDKWGNKGHASLSAGHCLSKGEQQGHVAVDAMLLLQDPEVDRKYVTGWGAAATALKVTPGASPQGQSADHLHESLVVSLAQRLAFNTLILADLTSGGRGEFSWASEAVFGPLWPDSFHLCAKDPQGGGQSWESPFTSTCAHTLTTFLLQRALTSSATNRSDLMVSVPQFPPL